VTLGHLDVIRRAAALYDEVVVAILHNPAKQGVFTPEQRRDLVLDTCAGVDGVRAEVFEARLLVDVAREVGAGVILKGLRSGTDYAYELPMALMNKHLSGVETVFLPAAPDLEHVSSSLVKEVVRYGGDVTGLVSDRVRDALVERLQAR
jgi:pantetheine-phosphate adenylyltransferase